jgi:hypothetical protein
MKDNKELDKHYEYTHYFPYWNLREILKKLKPKDITEVAIKRNLNDK